MLNPSIPPAAVQRARELADQALDSIARKIAAGAPFFATYTGDLLEISQEWRRTLDERTSRLALELAADDVAIRTRVQTLRAERKSFWRL
jgi:hypothetical protein